MADKEIRIPVTILKNHDDNAARRSELRSFSRLTRTATPGLRLEQRLVQLGLRQKLLEPGILLIQLKQPPGCLSLQLAVLLSQAAIWRLGQLENTSDLDDGLTLDDRLLGALELVDDLYTVCLEHFRVRTPGQSGRVRTHLP